jgi:hypothetical protein
MARRDWSSGRKHSVVGWIERFPPQNLLDASGESCLGYKSFYEALPTSV